MTPTARESHMPDIGVVGYAVYLTAVVLVFAAISVVVRKLFRR
jgi:hypothetical protein